MTDYSQNGAIPVDDAAVPHPPTVDEVLARQRERHEPTEDDEVPAPEIEDEGIAALVNNTGLDGGAASG
jgi:hypothetical protein